MMKNFKFKKIKSLIVKYIYQNEKINSKYKNFKLAPKKTFNETQIKVKTLK